MSEPNEGRLLNNRYQLLERFGAGGMATIYRARDTLLDRYVAIKILREDKDRNPGFEQQFQHGARAAANLSRQTSSRSTNQGRIAYAVPSSSGPWCARI
jgi:serine/threonine protein kinase